MCAKYWGTHLASPPLPFQSLAIQGAGPSKLVSPLLALARSNHPQLQQKGLLLSASTLVSSQCLCEPVLIPDCNYG